MRKWDWTKYDKMTELVREIRKELIEKGIIRNPVISFGDGVSQELQQDLRLMVLKMGGRSRLLKQNVRPRI
jgi:hypothetical protein